MIKFITLVLGYLLFNGSVYSSESIKTELNDSSRGRVIPVQIIFPSDKQNCQSENESAVDACRVVILSSGYGVQYTGYSFITNALAEQGYLVIAIQHELAGDPKLSRTGDLFKTRSENWQRGAQTLKFVRAILMDKYKAYDFNNVVLIGHSNGGDISAWLANENIDYVAQVITLDHRRVPLPRNSNIETLTIRASDFEADPNVLFTYEEQLKYGGCLVKVNKAKHNEMTDYGPEWLKQAINRHLHEFLSGDAC